jgi:hypothetical protein
MNNSRRTLVQYSTSMPMKKIMTQAAANFVPLSSFQVAKKSSKQSAEEEEEKEVKVKPSMCMSMPGPRQKASVAAEVAAAVAVVVSLVVLLW